MIYEVYLAREIESNYCLALKIIKKNVSAEKEYMLKAASNEAKILNKLNHPYIPIIKEIIENDDYFCIAMEYVEGNNLEKIVNEWGAQPFEAVLKWTREICEVLSYLHSQNPPIIYRDLKPSNIIVQNDGNIRLVDFSLVRFFKPEKLADTAPLGTRGYVPPEQYGSRQTDARSDIFSLGMTLYFLLTTQNPKSREFIQMPLCSVLPNLPKGIGYIVDKCTRIEMEDRYQSCYELLKDLDNYDNLPPKRRFFI